MIVDEGRGQRTGPYGRKRTGGFGNGCRSRVLGPSAPPVNPVSQDSFRLACGVAARLEQSHRDSRLIKRRQSRTFRATSLHLWHRANSAKECQAGARVPRSRNSVPTSRIHNVVLFPPSQGGWGPPGWTCHGEGWGAISFVSQKTFNSDLLLAVSERASGQEAASSLPA